jgi:hypothetical protein
MEDNSKYLGQMETLNEVISELSLFISSFVSSKLNKDVQTVAVLQGFLTNLEHKKSQLISEYTEGCRINEVDEVRDLLTNQMHKWSAV